MAQTPHISATQGPPPLAASVDAALHDIFGFDDFREGQRDVVESIVAGNHSLVVMPTGSGKSLCYQLPACVIDGVTLVVSPLIALMKDQLDAMIEFGVPTTVINSSLTWDEQRSRLFDIAQGAYKVVYVAPERFRNHAFCEAISKVKVGLFAIDEAHCISQWGHDFRPDYLTLGDVRPMLGNPPTLALTATATPDVQSDIIAQLDLPDANVVVSGFERPNLFFEVFHARRKEDKMHRLHALLDHYGNASAVIYCATRKQVEEVAAGLTDAGRMAVMYHGGLGDAQRESVQDAFMAGDAPLLVATNAFGMGVDKPDVRAIIHYNMPGSIEAYYQEAGRAGRDGKPAHCLLLYNYVDRGIHEFFTQNSFPARADVERVWTTLLRQGVGTHPMGSDQIASHVSRAGRGKGTKVHSWAVESALRLLQRAGHIDFGVRDGFPWTAVIDNVRVKDLRVDWNALDRRRELDERHLLDVIRYSSGQDCRQRFLLRYFSSKFKTGTTCGHCDACSGRPEYATNAGPQNTGTIVSDEPAKTVIRKVLSGVARTRGGWGAHMVASMLRGSTAKRIKSGGLDRLSTYGLLHYMRQQDVVELLDMCQRSRLTTQNMHGCLSLTEEGVAVMMGEQELPGGLDQLLQVKLKPPGAASTRSGSSGSKSTRSPGGGRMSPNADSAASTTETYKRTLELIDRGMNFREIAAERHVTTSTILRHLMVLAEQGHALDIKDQLDGQLLPALRDAAEGWNHGDPLAPLKERLPVSCTYDELKLHLAQILLERHAGA